MCQWLSLQNICVVNKILCTAEVIAQSMKNPFLDEIMGMPGIIIHENMHICRAAVSNPPTVSMF